MSMIGKDKLVFDPSVALSESDNIGSYLRSSASGALITNQSAIKNPSISFGFVDGDVTVGTDTIAEASHGLFTGDKVQLTSSGTLPAGLALLTDYYVIRVDANSFKLASSPENAELGVAVDITAAAGGGTHTLTTQDSDVRGLDVWIRNPSVVVSDGGNSISIDDNGGSITVDGSVTVSATDLDIRDLVYTQDSVTAYQGTDPWVIGDGGGSITVDGSVTVSATDLDIRDLSHTQDSVKIGDGVDFLAVNADGSINVNADISVTSGAEKAEDSAHVSGDIGQFALAVRNDAGGSMVDTDGDYAPLQVDAQGRLRVSAQVALDAQYAEDSVHNSGDIGLFALTVQDNVLAASAGDGDYAAFKSDRWGRLWVNESHQNLSNGAVTVDDTVGGVQIASSALSGRKRVLIQNLGNKAMYIGASGVTTANGTRVAAGANAEFLLEEAASLYGIAASGDSVDVRFMQFA